MLFLFTDYYSFYIRDCIQFVNIITEKVINFVTYILDKLL